MCFWLQREAHFRSWRFRLVFVCSLAFPVLAAKWVGTCVVRVGWERVLSDLGGNASRQKLCLCLSFVLWNVVFWKMCFWLQREARFASGCSGKHVFSSFFNDFWRIFNDFFKIFSWFVHDFFAIFSNVSGFVHDLCMILFTIFHVNVLVVVGADLR